MIYQIDTISHWLEYRDQIKNNKVGFVPTMGALHSGHLSLIKKSLSENEITIVSIFVNKTQFNDQADLDNYPKTMEQDKILIESICNDSDNLILFTPTFAQMYPDNYTYKLTESERSLDLCGKDRPGHFDGVLTIVLKLFNLVKPSRAYFGEKDYQQLELIQNMVSALFLDVEVIPCPIVRDEQGLAHSSRNKLLTAPEKVMAQGLNKVLAQIEDEAEIAKRLGELGFEVDYVKKHNQRKYVAAKIGKVRLIDNMEARS